MDRLTDLASPNLRNRNDPSDIARPKEFRSRREGDVETQASGRTQDRDRGDRKQIRSERFSVNVEAPSVEPATREAPASEVQDSARSSAERVQDDAAKSASAGARPASSPAKPKAVAPTAEPKVAQPALTLPESSKAEEPRDQQAMPEITPGVPLRIVPAVVPASAAQAPSREQPVAVDPRTQKSSAAADAPIADVLSGTPKAVEARPAPHSAVQSAPNPAAGARTDPKPAEVVREAPAPLPARDVERAADILRQVRVQLAPHTHEAHIQLQPLELGRISIRISVEEGRMRTTVRAEKQEALSAIQAHLPELKAALRQHGLEAQDFQLSLGLEQRPPRDDAREPARPRKSVRDAADSRPSEHALLLRATAGASGIDLYA